ncbi:MAG: hypothetical protein IMZ75_13450, partial [Actinobacteria bacterium]|nr:hypothetical protein [Actinomycetota bacterium]
VQLIDRVTWDDIIIPPEANELGWKGTVRVSPLEDSIVALRPVVSTSPIGAKVPVAGPTPARCVSLGGQIRRQRSREPRCVSAAVPEASPLQSPPLSPSC